MQWEKVLLVVINNDHNKRILVYPDTLKAVKIEWIDSYISKTFLEWDKLMFVTVDWQKYSVWLQK
jgi:hypothetical protein